MKNSPLPSPSDAARALGSIRSRRKAASSRRNGRLGGRPPLPSCSVRELRRRVRVYCDGACLSWIDCRKLQAEALVMREVWNSPPCSGFSVGDLAHGVEFPLDRLSLHRKAIAHLVPREPVLL